MLYPFPASFVAQPLVSGVYQATLIPPLGYSIESVPPASVDKFWVQQIEYANGSVVIHGEAEQPAWLQSLTLIAVADGPGGVKRYNPRVTISEGTWPLVTPQVVWIGVRVKNPGITDWVFPYVPSSVLWQEPGSLVVGADALAAPLDFGTYGSVALLDPSRLTGYVDGAEITGPMMNYADPGNLQAFAPHNYPSNIAGAGFIYKASLVNGKAGLLINSSANFQVNAITSIATPTLKSPLWKNTGQNGTWYVMMVMDAYPYLYGASTFLDTGLNIMGQNGNRITYYDYGSHQPLGLGPTINLAPCILEWGRSVATGRMTCRVNGTLVYDAAATTKVLSDSVFKFFHDGGYGQGELALLMAWLDTGVTDANINAARSAAATRFGITLP